MAVVGLSSRTDKLSDWQECLTSRRSASTVGQRREVALGVMRDYQVSQRRVCVLIGVDPKTVRRERPTDHGTLREAMREIAGQRPRFGYRRIGVMWECKGMSMNHKKL
jgi:hypothetical protein